MPTATSFHAADAQPEQVRAIIADHLALEHIRIFRRLLVQRCGAIALAIAVAGVGLGWLPPFASWFSISIFLGAPVCAWVIELQRQRRWRAGWGNFRAIPFTSFSRPPRKKVVKSS
jgi:hypothetical protein